MSSETGEIAKLEQAVRDAQRTLAGARDDVIAAVLYLKYAETAYGERLDTDSSQSIDDAGYRLDDALAAYLSAAWALHGVEESQREYAAEGTATAVPSEQEPPF